MTKQATDPRVCVANKPLAMALGTLLVVLDLFAHDGLCSSVVR